MENYLYAVVLAALVGVIFAIILWVRVNRAEAGTDKMKEIAGAIHEGAMAFMRREYTYLAAFVVVLAIVLAVAPGIDPLTAVCFVVGAVF
jgi:K(+)-stimulated pyrophosphate-energized sodium pump